MLAAVEGHNCYLANLPHHSVGHQCSCMVVVLKRPWGQALITCNKLQGERVIFGGLVERDGDVKGLPSPHNEAGMFILFCMM